MTVKVLILAVLLVLILTFSAAASTPTQHIAISLSLEEYTDTPFEAFTVGFVSHAILDAIPPHQYTFDIFNPTHKDSDIIVVEGLASSLLLIKYWNDENKRYAMLGALTPDIIDGILCLADNERWYRGDHLFPWHERERNSEKLSKGTTIVLTLFAISLHF